MNFIFFKDASGKLVAIIVTPHDRTPLADTVQRLMQICQTVIDRQESTGAGTYNYDCATRSLERIGEEGYFVLYTKDTPEINLEELDWSGHPPILMPEGD